ncbi:MAG: 1-acyl-sn-glycerol-3-phosphate acyltransferase [Candidatus Moduliflexus flocculans]|nr:1-acyl-sn-glycerol-3-phosphate acyltransferase [Candidatus Moduliflexus flocculans]
MRNFVAGFVLTVLTILAIPVILVCALLGLRDGFLAYGVWMMKVGRLLLGIDIDASGLERLDRNTPYVFMCNHLSFLDAPMLVTVIDRPVRFIVKRFVFRIPVLGLGMRFAGYVPLDKEGVGEGRKADRPGQPAHPGEELLVLGLSRRDPELGGEAPALPAGRFLPGPRLRGAHRPGVDPRDLRADAARPPEHPEGDRPDRLPRTPLCCGLRRRRHARTHGEGEGRYRFGAFLIRSATVSATSRLNSAGRSSMG